MSYLNDPRVLFAAERTLLAWQRTAIALVGFGFVVEHFGLFLRMVNNRPLSPSQRGFSLWLGVVLLLIGAAVSVLSAVQFRTVLRGLGGGGDPARRLDASRRVAQLRAGLGGLGAGDSFRHRCGRMIGT
jgi:putative membrane protein